MNYNLKKSKHKRTLAKLATFWIIVPQLRRRLRNYLVTDDSQLVSRKAQDLLLFKKLQETEHLIVFLVPEINTISGGIYSIFSIAKQSRKFKSIHKSDVIVMTIPNKNNKTYFRQTYFRNEEIVYRFDQLLQFRNLKTLTIHVPEFFSRDFYARISEKERSFIKNIPNTHINILNQNIVLMPKAQEFENLYKLTPNISQTVAHHSYASQEMANRYGLKTLLLPAYTDLSNYPKSGFEEKEDIIIYSPDEHPEKASILELLKKELPKYELIEIWDISFDEFMELVTRAKFGITFGEGFDGYLAQPIHQGGISFAVYNEDFFPDKSYLNFSNIFKSFDELKQNLVVTIKRLESSKQDYTELNQSFVSTMDALYSFEHYCDCIKNFYLGAFDYQPEKKPLGTENLEISQLSQ